MEDFEDSLKGGQLYYSKLWRIKSKQTIITLDPTRCQSILSQGLSNCAGLYRTELSKGEANIPTSRKYCSKLGKSLLNAETNSRAQSAVDTTILPIVPFPTTHSAAAVWVENIPPITTLTQNAKKFPYRHKKPLFS